MNKNNTLPDYLWRAQCLKLLDVLEDHKQCYFQKIPVPSQFHKTCWGNIHLNMNIGILASKICFYFLQILLYFSSVIGRDHNLSY